MNEVIYQIFVRNYSKEGTFLAIQKDLDRIKRLGVDIIYLMPIHEIGVKNRKGTWGSPYAIKDYYSISFDLGDLTSFKNLIKAIHDKGMKVIMDMVFNHTAPDNELLINHPEYYFYRNGKTANKVGDWSDIIDLETKDDKTQEYLLGVIEYWVHVGVDGFRFDVSSLIPLSFFKKLRERFGKRLFLLSESIDPDFVRYAKSIGIDVTTDDELAPYFDVLYNYNYFRDLEHYLKGEAPLKNLVDALNDEQNKYNRICCLENHDTKRIYDLVHHDKERLLSLLRFSFTLKGCPFLYAGEELGTDKNVPLFEKDPIDWSVIDHDINQEIKSLIKAKKKEKAIKQQTFKLIDESTIEIATVYVDGTDSIKQFSF